LEQAFAALEYWAVHKRENEIDEIILAAIPFAHCS